MKPGHCKTEDINYGIKVTDNRIDSILRFITYPRLPIADVGSENYVCNMLKKKLNVPIDSITADDFNFDNLKPYHKTYKTIFCFEVVEHLQNPLWFMQQLKKKMDKDSLLYISLPSKPFFLYIPVHYFEIPPKHFEKWILQPLGLEIVKQSKISFQKSWTEYFIGFRPLFRILTTRVGWKELFVIYKYHFTNIYEIKIK